MEKSPSPHKELTFLAFSLKMVPPKLMEPGGSVLSPELCWRGKKHYDSRAPSPKFWAGQCSSSSQCFGGRVTRSWAASRWLCAAVMLSSWGMRGGGRGTLGSAAASTLSRLEDCCCNKGTQTVKPGLVAVQCWDRYYEAADLGSYSVSMSFIDRKFFEVT